MTIMLMLAKTHQMSRTNLPFVLCKSCMFAYDVDLGKIVASTRGALGIIRKKRLDGTINSTFEARCAYCNKLSQYSKGDALYNTDRSSGDSKLAEMKHAEHLALYRKVRIFEAEIKKLTKGKLRVERERDRIADTLDRLQRGEAPQEPKYKKRRLNPLSG